MSATVAGDAIPRSCIIPDSAAQRDAMCGTSTAVRGSPFPSESDSFVSITLKYSVAPASVASSWSTSTTSVRSSEFTTVPCGRSSTTSAGGGANRRRYYSRATSVATAAHGGSCPSGDRHQRRLANSLGERGERRGRASGCRCPPPRPRRRRTEGAPGVVGLERRVVAADELLVIAACGRLAHRSRQRFRSGR